MKLGRMHRSSGWSNGYQMCFELENAWVQFSARMYGTLLDIFQNFPRSVETKRNKWL